MASEFDTKIDVFDEALALNRVGGLNKFFENVLCNRGAQVTVFSDRRAAVELANRGR